VLDMRFSRRRSGTGAGRLWNSEFVDVRRPGGAGDPMDLYSLLSLDL
jgi:hypothetical protein